MGKFHVNSNIPWVVILHCQIVLHWVGNHRLITCWNASMQGLVRWLAGRYASYDEFSFWRTEARRDHSKLSEQVEYLKHQVNSLTAKINASSPLCTPTRIIDELMSPDVESMPRGTSESPGTVAVSRGHGVRKAPRKDLEECFNECDDPVPNTQMLPSRLARGSKGTGTPSRLAKADQLALASKSPRSLTRGRKEVRLAACMKSPGTLSREPKDIRQGHMPQREQTMTTSTMQGNVKRAKGTHGGEGKLDRNIVVCCRYYIHMKGIQEQHCCECIHLYFQL